MSDLVSIVSSSALVVLVAVLLRNLLSGSPAPAAAPDPAETALREMAAAFQARDLTVPRTQDLAVMVLALPDYPRLVRERPLESVFSAVNHFYRVATEVADRNKGEVATLVGGEICVMFGRILPVEKPFQTAAASALEIVARFRAELPDNVAFRGAAAAVVEGPALSGPVGGEWRRTYASVGTPIDDAQTLVRTMSPNEVRTLTPLATRLEGFEIEPPGPDAPSVRILSQRPALS